MPKRRVLIRSIAWLPLLCFTGWVESKSVRLEPGPGLASGEMVREVTYRITDDGRAPKLDLYLPREEDRPGGRAAPAVLLIHGGSWIGGSKAIFRNDPGRSATRLTRHGYVVIAVDYLLAQPGHPSWPGAVDDIREAVRWTRRHASEYGIDADRIALLGQSAGGHLAMLVGANPNTEAGDGPSSKVQAVVNLYGPSDLTALRETRDSRRDPILTFLGEQAGQANTALEADASPVGHVDRSAAPTLLFCGTDDLWVPPEQSARLSRLLTQAGVMNELVVIEGARHGFETVVESPKHFDLLPGILAFLSKVWNLSSPDLSR